MGPGLAPSPAAAEMRERILEARTRKTRCRIVGAGTWLDAGRPVRADARLELAPHAGIVEYVPGDLTLTARAGTSLGELERATSAERQWLPLDPFGGDRGTLGATVATASAGPLAHGFGAVRDNVLGLEIVTGRGEVVRVGGRVVKNVAGFDLTRLMIGAWGTLGVITEVTVRLRARPVVDRTYAAPLPAGADAVTALLARLRGAPIAPLAMQLVSGDLAKHLGLDAADALLVRIGGNEESVRAQQSALEAMMTAVEVPGDIWVRFGEAEPDGATTVRTGGRASELGARWHAMRAAIAAADGGARPWLSAWVAAGTIRVIAPRSEHPQLLKMLGSPAVVVERLGQTLLPHLAPSAADAPLARRVREAFDPDRLLNPGILGESTP